MGTTYLVVQYAVTAQNPGLWSIVVAPGNAGKTHRIELL